MSDENTQTLRLINTDESYLFSKPSLKSLSNKSTETTSTKEPTDGFCQTDDIKVEPVYIQLSKPSLKEVRDTCDENVQTETKKSIGKITYPLSEVSLDFISCGQSDFSSFLHVSKSQDGVASYDSSKSSNFIPINDENVMKIHINYSDLLHLADESESQSATENVDNKKLHNLETDPKRSNTSIQNEIDKIILRNIANLREKCSALKNNSNVKKKSVQKGHTLKNKSKTIKVKKTKSNINETKNKISHQADSLSFDIEIHPPCSPAKAPYVRIPKVKDNDSLQDRTSLRCVKKSSRNSCRDAVGKISNYDYSAVDNVSDTLSKSSGTYDGVKVSSIVIENKNSENVDSKAGENFEINSDLISRIIQHCALITSSSLSSGLSFESTE